MLETTTKRPVQLIRLAFLLFWIPGVFGGAALLAESPAVEHETATFAMYCYWTGEATLGRVDGVTASRIGHWAGREIVQVDFDPRATDLDTLIAALRRQGSFDAVVVAKGEPSPAPKAAAGQVIQASGDPRFIEPKHSLRTRHPELWALGLDESQAMALNSWSYFGGPRPDVLTDEQRRALGQTP